MQSVYQRFHYPGFCQRSSRPLCLGPTAAHGVEDANVYTTTTARLWLVRIRLVVSYPSHSTLRKSSHVPRGVATSIARASVLTNDAMIAGKSSSIDIFYESHL